MVNTLFNAYHKGLTQPVTTSTGLAGLNAQFFYNINSITTKLKSSHQCHIAGRFKSGKQRLRLNLITYIVISKPLH
jgi:hypothetical protein